MGQLLYIHRPHQKAPGSDEHTLGELLAYYIAEVFPTKARNTEYQQTRFLSKLDREYGHLPLSAITPAWLRQWRDRLALHRLKPDTIRQYLDSLSAVLSTAVNELEWLDTNPLHGNKVRKPPLSRGRVRFLSPEEQGRLLAACQASRNQALYPLVFLALTTGARRGELLSLRWQDIDLDRGYLRLSETKNKDRRAVPVPTVTLEVLRAYRVGRRETEWVIPRQGEKTTFPGEHAWQAALLRAGLTGTFRFHDLRHTAASHLAMSGASLIEIAEILGHKTLAMVRRYSHFTQAHTRGVVERMALQFVPGPQPPLGGPHD
jgi:integrase